MYSRKYCERESYQSKEMCFIDWLLNCPLKLYDSTIDLLKLTKYFIVCQISNCLESLPGLTKVLSSMSFITEKEASLMKDVSLLKHKSDDKVAFGKQLIRFSRDHFNFLLPNQYKNCQSVAVLCQCKKITRDVYFDIFLIYNGSKVGNMKMINDLPTGDWTLKQAITFLLNFENEHYQMDGCIENAEIWSLIFDLKSLLNTCLLYTSPSPRDRG